MGKGGRESTRTKRVSRRPAVRRQTSDLDPGQVSSPLQNQEGRHRMIAEAAYYRAEARGFREGDPVQDWLAAEAEIDARLPGRRDPGGRGVRR